MTLFYFRGGHFHKKFSLFSK